MPQGITLELTLETEESKWRTKEYYLQHSMCTWSRARARAMRSDKFSSFPRQRTYRICEERIEFGFQFGFFISDCEGLIRYWFKEAQRVPDIRHHAPLNCHTLQARRRGSGSLWDLNELPSPYGTLNKNLRIKRTPNGAMSTFDQVSSWLSLSCIAAILCGLSPVLVPGYRISCRTGPWSYNPFTHTVILQGMALYVSMV
jgi:hypothetical protein